LDFLLADIQFLKFQNFQTKNKIINLPLRQLHFTKNKKYQKRPIFKALKFYCVAAI